MEPTHLLSANVVAEVRGSSLSLGGQERKVRNLTRRLVDVLTAETPRSVSSVSVMGLGASAPLAYWVPESDDEPTFLAYSITKTFTATLVLQLCEEQRLHLDDTVATWFPEIDQAARITLRHLLNHTAGM